MSWSVQLPNPLTVGGNGDIGEIDILNPNGTTGILITGGVGGGGPEIRIIDVSGNLLQLFVSGSPVINWTYGGGRTGFGTLSLGTFGAGSAQNYYQIGFSTTTGDFVNFILQESPTGVGQIYATHPIIASDPALSGNPGNNETWHGFSYNNAWSDRGGGYDAAQYRVMPDGTVRLRGSAKGGTTVDFTQLATLPVGYRPTNSKEFLSKSTVANSSIIINSAGGIFCLGMGAATNLVFDGITFERPLI